VKPILILSLSAAALLLGGCETTVVENDNHYGHGYHGSGYHGSGYRGDSAVVVVDSNHGYGHHDGYNRHYNNDSHGGYASRNVERTNVHVNETNVNRTVVNKNVNKTNVTRTNTNVNVQKAPQGHGQPVAQAQGKKNHKGKGQNDDQSH